MKWLAVDYGDSRTGLAGCDAGETITSPITPQIEEKSMNKVAAAVTAVAQARGAEALVCGLPKNMDGTEGARAGKSRRLAGKVEEASGLPGFLIDQGGHIALHRHLAPFRRQLPQGQALSLDDQCPQARMQHHALLVEADHLRHAGDAEAPALVEGQLVGQNFLFLGHGHSPFALGTAYVRLTRNIPPLRKAPGSSPVSG